jgi:CDP-diacylglycerol--serine O-phosphatidyltransferase
MRRCRLRPDASPPNVMASAFRKRYIAPMAIGQSPFGDRRLPPRQFRRIPVRTLAPNLVTLLALCAGLTGIRMAFENRYGLALAAIVFAAVLDGIDGRLARLLKGTSKFGAELDSLSDFVNFGVAPGLILYFWGLHDLKSAGWIAAMAFAICAGLRLARFNVMSADPDRPVWAANFFVGVPAPAGAIIVLLPIYAAFLGLPRSPFLTWVTLAYTLAIAALLVSRLPVFSGKRIGTRVPPEMVGPVIILLVLFVALLIAYPWIILTIGTLCYLASLPFGWVSYRSYEERAREGRAEASATAASSPNAASRVQLADDEERPPRLN